MPYIITTTDPQHVCLTTPDRCGQEPLITRRAVATLEEAKFGQDSAQAILNAAFKDSYRHPEYDRLSDAVVKLLDGGTIGPLPDGTVIEVERITWPALALSAGLSYPAQVGGMAARGSDQARSEILAAASPKKRHDDRGA